MAPQMHILASRTVRALTGSQSNQHFQSLAFFSLSSNSKILEKYPKSFPFSKGFSLFRRSLGRHFLSFFKLFSRNILKGGGQSHSSWIQQKVVYFQMKNCCKGGCEKLSFSWAKKGVQKRKWVKMKVCFKISWQLTRSKVNDGLSRPKVLGLTL